MAPMVARIGIFGAYFQAQLTYRRRKRGSKRGVGETSLAYNEKTLNLNSKSNIRLDLEFLAY
jgi:hypothetical protein